MTRNRSLFERLEQPAADPANGVTSVAAHLGKMLSIRAGSVQTLPDLNDMHRSLHESLSQSRVLIERFIRAYEPRLKQVRVRALPRGHDPLALAFAIDATLCIAGETQPVAFTAHLRDAGQVEVLPDVL